MASIAIKAGSHFYCMIFVLPTAFSSDGRILRNTYQNVNRVWLNAGQVRDTIEGEILAFTYNNNLYDTTLRLTASGSHRIAMPSSLGISGY